MIHKFIFTIEPKAHADATMFTRQGRAYTPAAKKAYQLELLRTFKPLTEWDCRAFSGPLMASWTFLLPRPKFLIRMYPNLFLWRDKKPDTDGFLKCVKDVIQDQPLSLKAKKKIHGIGLIQNDEQIALEITEKLMVPSARKPCIVLALAPLDMFSKSPVGPSLLKQIHDTQTTNNSIIHLPTECAL